MIDVEKIQTMRLRVAYGNVVYDIDLPVPQIVPPDQISGCTVVVLGLSNPKPNTGHCGWKKA